MKVTVILESEIPVENDIFNWAVGILGKSNGNMDRSSA